MFNFDIAYPDPQGTEIPPTQKNEVDVSAANIFVVPNVPLLTVPLDPTLQYRLTILQPSQNRTVGGLSSVTYYSAISKESKNETEGNNPPGPSDDGKSDGIAISKGAIAGIVVAIIAAIALIAAAAWWFVRHRGKRRG
jgi:hypothetical protein